MIATMMILCGTALMLVPVRAVPDVRMAGDVLREAYGGTAAAPVPRDMRRALGRIEPVLHLVGGSARR